MANFGTPTVIGTLTSTTNQSTYTVPITVATGASDAISVFSASNTPSAGAPSVTNVTDSKGNQYVLITQTTVNQLVSEWRAFDCVALTTSDTVTVTFGSATGNLKDIMVVDLPGVSTYPAIDSVATLNSPGNNSNPNISIPAGTQPVELQLVACVTSNTQGIPSSGFGPFTTFTSLHSGSAEWLTVGYLITTTSQAQTLTFNVGGIAGQWGIIASASFPNIQPEFVQQPFPVGQLPPQVAFNPAYSTQLRWNPGQAGSAVTPSISFLGSQTNVITGANANLHLGDASTFEATNGSWSGGTSMNVSRVFNQAHSGSFSLKLNPTATGARNFLSSTVANLPINGIRVNPGDTVLVGFWVMADPSFAAEQFTAGVDFYDVNTNQIGGTTSGATFTDALNSWTFVYVETTVPANAYWSRAHHTVTVGAIGNLHYVDDMVYYDLSTSSSPGSVAIYTPSNQQFNFAPTGIPFPLNLNPVLQFAPRQFATAQFTPVFTAGTTGTVSVTAPAGNVVVSQNFSPQYPFFSITPLFMQITPTLSWHLPRHITGNNWVNIDGGTPAQVTANAQFSDQTVTVSVSATTNVSVVAPPPQGNVNGVTANVNVVAVAGSLNETLAGTTATVNVAAIAGTVVVNRTGVVANVSVAAPNGTAVVSPQGNAGQVNVAMAGDNVIVITMGTTGHVNVASTGVATVTPQGPAGNVNVVAIAGTVNQTLPGVTATVAVASTGATVTNPLGNAANVTVTALAGTIVKTPSIIGIPASVTVASFANPTVAVSGQTANVTVTARTGSVSVSVPAPSAKVTVVAYAGQAGHITISGSLVNPGLAEDLLLSDQGKLLDIRVKNILVSADKPLRPQGI